MHISHSDVEPATAEEAVLSAMMSLGRRVRQRLPGDTLDFSAMPILGTLCHQGPMRLSALATSLQLDASTVSRHARHLEERGLIQRACDPDDGRASRVAVSQRGSECLEKAAEMRHAMIAEVLQNWSEADRELLRVLLARLHRDLTPSNPSQETT